jgi:hypothetical protein
MRRRCWRSITYLEDVYYTTLYHVLVLVIRSIEAVPRISSGSQRGFRRLISPELPTAHAIISYMIVEVHGSDDKGLDSLIGTSSAACEASNINSIIINLVHTPTNVPLFELCHLDSRIRTSSTAHIASDVNPTTNFVHTRFAQRT